MTSLRKKMEADLRIRGMSQSTSTLYLHCVRRFAEYHGRSPALMGTEQVRQYLLHLRDMGRTPATIVVYRAALLFVYKVTLLRPEVMNDVPRPRIRARDPVPALTESEVSALLSSCSSPYDEAFFSMLYGTGMRVAEGCQVQVGDIDVRTGLIHIRQGKGGKARSVKLSALVLAVLRGHWKRYRPRAPWLFPARRMLRPGTVRGVLPWADKPVSTSTMGTRFREARQRAGLKRNATLHDFRRAYATRLREAGVDLRDIQVVLGHSSPTTTALYVSVSPVVIRGLPCPLERLE